MYQRRLKLTLKPVYVSVELLSVLVTVHVYTTLLPSLIHFPCRGQDSGPPRQLHGLGGGVGGGGGGTGGGGGGTGGGWRGGGGGGGRRAGGGAMSSINPPQSSSQTSQALAFTGTGSAGISGSMSVITSSRSWSISSSGS